MSAHSAHSGRISLFNSFYEKLTIWPNLLVLPLMFGLYFSGWSGGFEIKQWSIFLACTLFLNSVHHGFGIALCLTVPEIKQMLQKKYENKRFGFWPRFLAVYFAGVLYFLVFKEVLPIEINYTLYLTAFILIDCLSAVHHQVSQTKGLTLLYNKKILDAGDSSSKTKTKVKKIYFYEKLLYNILFICIGVQVVEGVAEINVTKDFSLAVGVVAAIGLIITAFLSQNSIVSNKSLFSLKAVTYAFSSIFWPFHIMTRINHGLEYLGVVNKVYKNSTGRKIKLMFSLGLFGVAALLLATFNYHTGIVALIKGEGSTPTLGYQIIHALAIARSISHYYVDRVLFHFRHEENRALMMPLLFKDETKSESSTDDGSPLVSAHGDDLFESYQTKVNPIFASNGNNAVAYSNIKDP